MNFPRFCIHKKVCQLVAFCLLAFSYTAFAQQPTAGFTATPVQGCTPLIVNFTDQSTNAVQWQWNLGNGATSVLQNPSATYFTPGSYTITLIVTSAGGQRDTLIRSNYIVVRALPQVNFTATPQSGCFPLNVQFTDNTSANNTAVSWLWDFGDGSTATGQNPAHTYSSTGTYDVTLIVTNEFGCTASLTRPNFVQVGDGVQANFSVQSQGCAAPQVAQFTNTSTGTGALTYLWNFGDGSTSTAINPSHTYTANGNYTVSLVATNASGCADTFIISNAIVLGNINIDFTSPATACANNTIAFNISTTPIPTTALWNFGDGTTSTTINPVKSYSTPGIYTITLYANVGSCADTVVKTISIENSPTVDFIADDTLACQAPLTVQFNSSTSGGQTYSWDFGDGNTSSSPNPTHTYTSLGNYTVTLTVANSTGCSTTVVKPAYIEIAEPIITPITASGCAPLTVNFSNLVQSAVPIVNYLWNFGDGATSTAANPSHTYAAGTYTVTVTVTTADGCVDSLTMPQAIRAGIAPIPGFFASPLDVCARDSVVFTDTSAGSIDFWHWDFGDGGTANTQNPIHYYNDTGYFTITLVVGSNGCFDTIVKPNYIYVRPPIARFVFTGSCDNRFLKIFTDQSIGADTWLCDFGDGTTSTQQNPTHTYTAPGVYIVTLTVTNIQTGCEHSRQAEVFVANDVAAYTFNVNPGCRQNQVNFTASGSSSITNYNWDFGDGSTGTGLSTTHNYLQTGSYNPQLIITDVNGCTDTITQTISLQVFGPSANFTAADSVQCVQSTILFSDLSTNDGTHPIVQWDWNYGDGTIVNNATAPFTHTYTTGGNFTVTLVVTDAFGCKDTLSKSNFITISRPVASFTADTISCPGTAIQFSNTSQGNALAYQWNFGDGSSSTALNPTHIYTANGTFLITLTVTDTLGCSNTDSQQIIIATPVASFTVNDSVGTCPPLIVNFTNTSINYISFVWDFGDGSTSTANNPSHFYNSAGVYIATLTVTAAGGCTSVRSMTITVSGPSGSFSYTNPGSCAPTVVQFTSISQNTNSYVWDFNDGITLTTTDSIVSHIYEIPGAYVPKLILQDTSGCSVAIQGLDTIYINGVQALFEADTTLRCNAADVAFNNLSVSNQTINSYTWNFGDGNSSNATNPTHTYTQPGIYVVQLIATTTSGCLDTFVLPSPIRIVAAPQINVVASPNMCAPAAMYFNGVVLGGDTTGLQWQWNFSNGTTYNTQATDTLFISTPGIYTYTLIGTNQFGCADTVSSSFEVYGLPPVSAGADVQVCLGTPQTLQASGAQSYTWTPSIGLSCTTCNNPSANPDSTRLYVVQGIDANGCANTDTVLVTVVQRLQITAAGADTLCVGESATLTVSGAASYTWSPAASLNTTTGSTVIASPASTTLYSVVGDDGKNCFSDTAYVPIQVYPYPTVSLPADTTIEIGSTVTILPVLSTDVINVLWQSPPFLVSTVYPGIVVRPKTNSKYIAEVVNEGGCTARDEMDIFVTCGAGNVFIPNTFSPNADGANDVFYVRGTNVYRVKQMSIFNRWGEVVFYKTGINANDANTGWDGRYKGQLLNPDVYVYMIEVVCENGSTLLYKGNVTLIR